MNKKRPISLWLSTSTCAILALTLTACEQNRNQQSLLTDVNRQTAGLQNFTGGVSLAPEERVAAVLVKGNRAAPAGSNTGSRYGGQGVGGSGNTNGTSGYGGQERTTPTDAASRNAGDICYVYMVAIGLNGPVQGLRSGSYLYNGANPSPTGSGMIRLLARSHPVLGCTQDSVMEFSRDGTALFITLPQLGQVGVISVDSYGFPNYSDNVSINDGGPKAMAVGMGDSEDLIAIASNTRLTILARQSIVPQFNSYTFKPAYHNLWVGEQIKSLAFTQNGNLIIGTSGSTAGQTVNLSPKIYACDINQMTSEPASYASSFLNVPAGCAPQDMIDEGGYGSMAVPYSPDAIALNDDKAAYLSYTHGPILSLPWTGDIDDSYVGKLNVNGHRYQNHAFAAVDQNFLTKPRNGNAKWRDLVIHPEGMFVLADAQNLYVLSNDNVFSQGSQQQHIPFPGADIRKVALDPGYRSMSVFDYAEFLLVADAANHKVYAADISNGRRMAFDSTKDFAFIPNGEIITVAGRVKDAHNHPSQRRVASTNGGQGNPNDQSSDDAANQTQSAPAP